MRYRETFNIYSDINTYLMSESAVAFLDLPVHNMMSQEYPLRTVSPNVSFQTDLDINKLLPEIPSLLRLANSRFLMDKVDTNKIPDWDTLKNVTFDHDIYTAIQMISFDTLTGFDIGGKDIDKVLIDEMDDLDEVIDISEIYRNTMFDELRYGNAIIRKNYGSVGSKRRMISFEVINPALIVDMQMSPENKPMWWIFKTVQQDINTFFLELSTENIAFVDPDFVRSFNVSGYSDARVVGLASDIVHFKGAAPPYQKWGVGISQVAKILVEAKIDMLVDFGKIIKKEAGTREVVYVDVKGLDKGQRDTKIANTVTEMTEQRKRGSVVVLGKKGKDDVLDVKWVGSEGKVLDNFSMHYRDDILRAIRILTRLPPSFWLGEATNKATINTQLVVYNRFLTSLRWYANKRYVRGIFLPYLRDNSDPILRLRETPQMMFSDVAIQDPLDRTVINDVSVRNGTKSRHQVARENNYVLPEEDGEPIPELGGGGRFSQLLIDQHGQEAIGVESSV